MVLWEITLGTAYFLGLKRTYRLALKIQRRLISPKYPKLRQFAHSRTRYAFDMALKVHRNIQERDLEAGRTVGNWILRWLDRMKPSANIRGTSSSSNNSSSTNTTSNSKQLTNSSSNSSFPKKPDNYQRFGTSKNQDSGRHMFTSSRTIWPKTFPTIAGAMRPMNPAGSNTQYRQLSSIKSLACFRGNYGLVR